MRSLLTAKLPGAVAFVAACLLVSSTQAVSDTIRESICPWTVALERSGELASWQPRRMFTPFAVESEDGRAWLYLSGGNPSIMSRAQFDAFKRTFVDALRQVMPNLEAIDDGSTLTVTYENDKGIAGSPERRVHGGRYTLIDGCVVPMTLTIQGSGPTSDVLRLLDLVTLSR